MTHGALTYLRRQYYCVLRRCAALDALSTWLSYPSPDEVRGIPAADLRTEALACLRRTRRLLAAAGHGRTHPRQGFAAKAAGACLLAAIACPAYAGPEPCTGTTTLSCSGDQSAGIDVGPGASPPVTAIVVEGLSGEITPGAGTPGIRLHNQAGQAVLVGAGSALSPITINAIGDGASGIDVNGLGTPTPYVEWPIYWSPGDPSATTQLVLPTGPGGAGGNVSVDSHATITTDGNGASGISARSGGGRYPQAVIDSLQSFLGTDQASTFRVATVADDAANVGTAVNGSNGGSFTLSNVAGVGPTYSFNLDGIDFSTLSAGDQLETSVKYRVESTAGHGPSDAWLTVRITRLDDGSLSVKTSTYFSGYGRGYEADPVTYVAGGGALPGQVTLRPDFDAFMARQLADSAPGGGGGNVSVTAAGSIETKRDASLGQDAYGILAESRGGAGTAGSGGVFSGDSGGAGSAGGAVSVANSATIHTHGEGAHGIVASSAGGNGGRGGGASFIGDGGAGGNGAKGGAVTVVNSGNITTERMRAFGIFAQSVGGSAGQGGDGGWFIYGSGGGGGEATVNDAVSVTNSGTVITKGDDAHGILAQNIGGFGGSGGGAGGFAIYASGASGGNTGSGGNVTLSNSGRVETAGENANALMAQSIGGGGGAGGSADGWFGGGGSGSNGGAGGNVTVTNSGNLTTIERNASALFAQSVGGGGGNGGGAIAYGAFLSVAIGGGGGIGGDGGTVLARSTGGALKTGGTQSHGIYAQSVGGRGGNGGFAVAVAAGKGFSAALAVGGSGGKGGKGTDVQVESSSAITTTGESAYGVYAQSVGGGGGNGGVAVAASAAVQGIAASFAIGGDGEAGGNGGKVDVGKDAPITGAIDTKGAGAHGLFAQSVGGGGGRGGLSVAGTISVGSGASGSLTMSLGGSGGVGGAADTVTVNSAADISTKGEKAYGIKAQSVGGGGGDGGVAVAGSIGGPGSMQLTLSVGGSAGDGSSGGTVDVNTTAGSIETKGKDAHGIFAQSVGGGGGDGGIAVSGNLGLGGKNANIGISAGGTGGKGSVGGAVDVSNAASIKTHGEAAFGILAQSIGGGGGLGGAAFSGNGNLILAQQQGYNVNIGFAFGGSGGEGNAGGLVNVGNTGTIETFGTGAHGIFAESVGGGGGQGGSARTMSINVMTELEAKPLGQYVSFNLNLGGSGGKGGDGGTTTVINQGTIRTHGADSHGIYAQSVGAGGGSGGEGAHGFFGVPTFFIDKTPMYKQVSLSIGGSAGAAGDGKAVNVTQTGAITTARHGSYGIFAQSIGGGGGQGGKGVIGFTGTVGIGGSGGASGDGGAIKVKVDGDIDTYGGEAFGVFAQSVGGGGGIAGNIDRGATFLRQGGIGVGAGIVLNSGNGGNGGQVTVDGKGNIHTRGDASFGIFAQSVGGGGGVAGSGGGIAGFGASSLGMAGSAGGNGSGDLITVDWTGSILTEGENAHGIFAQSAGGKAVDVVIYDEDGNPTADKLTPRQNLAKDVRITVRGDVVTTGAGSSAILAHSEGDEGNGDITVRILGKGTVKGGSGTETAGIKLVGGKDNLIENTGWIGAAAGIHGQAILGDDGNDTVDNSGRIVGTLDLGAGANTLHNRKTGVLDTGEVVTLGAGRTFHNAGQLSPGGDGVAQRTRLDGNLDQTTDGATRFDLSLARQDSDHLDVDGSTVLAGSVRITPIDKGYARPGTQRVTVLSATDGVEATSLRLTTPASPIVRYALDTSQPGEIAVTSAVDFAPRGLSANERRLGTHINAIQSAGGSAAFAPFAASLLDLTDESRVAQAYEQLMPGVTGSIGTATTGSTLVFNNAMHSCRQREGDFRFVREGECDWVQLGGGEREQRRSGANPGYREDRRTVAAGVQRELQANTHLGFGVSYQDSDLDSDFSAVSGEHVLAGVILKRTYDATKVSASLSAGHGRYDSSRRIDVLEPGQRAKGSPRVWSASLHARVSHDLMQADGQRYLRPMLDLGVTHVYRRAYRESGAGGASLDVSGEKDTMVTLQPAVEFGGERKLEDGSLLRPYLRVGMTHYLTPNERKITASLQGAPEGVAPFTVTNRSERTYGDLSLGVEILNKDGATVRFDYSGQFSRKSSDNAVTLKLAIPF